MGHVVSLGIQEDAVNAFGQEKQPFPLGHMLTGRREAGGVKRVFDFKTQFLEKPIKDRGDRHAHQLHGAPPDSDQSGGRGEQNEPDTHFFGIPRTAGRFAMG